MPIKFGPASLGGVKEAEKSFRNLRICTQIFLNNAFEVLLSQETYTDIRKLRL